MFIPSNIVPLMNGRRMADKIDSVAIASGKTNEVSKEFNPLYVPLILCLIVFVFIVVYDGIAPIGK